MTAVERLQQYWSARRAARKLGVPARVLVEELERRGVALLKIGSRELIPEDALVELVQDSRKPTRVEAKTRGQLIARLAEQEVFGRRGAAS